MTEGPTHLRLAVFDCDGTLADGQAGVCEAMERAFASNGLAAPERQAIRRIVGLSLPPAIARLAPGSSPEQQGQLIATYKEAFREARLQGQLDERLFDGIEPLLRDLAARGWQLGVATGKSDRGLAATLAANGLADLFVTLQTADRHPSKPHPAMLRAAMDEALADPADTVMIGDTTFDIEMARAAGVRAIGVAWGYHEANELRAAGAEAVVATPAELLALLA